MLPTTDHAVKLELEKLACQHPELASVLLTVATLNDPLWRNRKRIELMRAVASTSPPTICSVNGSRHRFFTDEEGCCHPCACGEPWK